MRAVEVGGCALRTQILSAVESLPISTPRLCHVTQTCYIARNDGRNAALTWLDAGSQPRWDA
eukprot:5399117-Amphidinium_carterae.1